MKKTGGYVFRLIKDNFFTLACFEFVFKSSAFILFVPLIVQLMNIATNNAGITYITTRNVAMLMRNPVMLMLTAVMLMIFICISYYEVCCLWSCFYNYRNGVRMTVTDMFTDGYGHLKKTSRRYGFRIYLQMAAITPMLFFHMSVILLKRLDILENCVRYLFRGIQLKNLGIISAAAAVLLFSAATQKFGKTISDGENGLKYFFRRTLHLVVLNALTGLVLIVLYLLLVLLAAVFLRFVSSEKYALVYLIRVENVIYYILAFLAGAMGVISNIALMFAFHNKQPKENSRLAKKKKSFRRKLVTVLILIVSLSDINTAAGYIINGSHVLEDIFIGTRVTAHRGGAKYVPENTMYGVEYAIKSGADYIEIDVQLSSDGVVFLLHDDNLKRTTGSNRLAYNLTYEELSKLDAGSWFDSKYSDAYIPTLDEVLAACKSRINLNIEIKKSRNPKLIVNEVLELINRYEMKEQCVITSTEYSYLKMIKEKEPGIRTGYISNMLFGEAASLEYADFFSVKYVVVTENFVRSAHQAGKEVHVWTVNTKPLINRMKGLDVDSIITDNPSLCRKILSRKNDRKSFAEILQTFLYRNR